MNTPSRTQLESQGRRAPEWIGATPDSRVPPRVRIRVFEAYEGRCYLSGRKIMPGDKWEIEHIRALILGGENRENNLAPALVAPHRAKTRMDVKIKAKVARQKAKHLGVHERGKGWRKHPTLKRTVSGQVVERRS